MALPVGVYGVTGSGFSRDYKGKRCNMGVLDGPGSSVGSTAVSPGPDPRVSGG